MTDASKPHSIAEIRDSLICGCDPQIFSAGEHGHDCPIVLFDGLVEQLEAALRDRDAIGAALGEPCAECGHIDWRSDGYADDLFEQLEALEKDARRFVQAAVAADMYPHDRGAMERYEQAKTGLQSRLSNPASEQEAS